MIATMDPFARVREPRLPQIAGAPVDLSALAGHCPFLARCADATETCLREPEPDLSPADAANDAHLAAYYDPIPTRG